MGNAHPVASAALPDGVGGLPIEMGAHATFHLGHPVDYAAPSIDCGELQVDCGGLPFDSGGTPDF